MGWCHRIGKSNILFCYYCFLSIFCFYTSEILSTFTQSADSLNYNARMLRLVLKESISS